MKPKSQPVRRLLVLAVFLLLAGVTGLLVDTQQVRAYTSYLTAAENQYPILIGTKLDSCQLCHPSGGYSLNSYASDYADAGRNLSAIEQLDSDKDGFSNIAEINALKWPGDANDYPAATNTPTPTSAPATATVTPTASPTNPGSTPASTMTPTATNIPPASPTASPTALSGPGPTPTRIPLAAPVNRFVFLGEVSEYPNTPDRSGDWMVSGRVVHVTAVTWLEQPGILGEHSDVWVWGTRAAGDAVNATYIRVLSHGEDDEVGPPSSITPSPTATRAASRTPRPAATITPTRTPKPEKATPTRTPTRAPTRTPKPTDDDVAGQ